MPRFQTNIKPRYVFSPTRECRHRRNGRGYAIFGGVGHDVPHSHGTRRGAVASDAEPKAGAALVLRPCGLPLLRRRVDRGHRHPFARAWTMGSRLVCHRDIRGLAGDSSATIGPPSDAFRYGAATWTRASRALAVCADSPTCLIEGRLN